MKKTFSIVILLIGTIVLSQENKLEKLDNIVNSIEKEEDLKLTEFDWTKLTNINTDGGGILRVWKNETEICKIVEEIGLSYGRIRTIIYLENEKPVKIIETEENFERKNNELNYNKLKEVFKAEIYVFDWENDKREIIRTGRRNMSEGNCSTFDYESIIERAKKAVKK